jgi:hypothetical protein
MIFGGSGHQTYLGCLNCSDSAPDSVFNQYGQKGSRYDAESIWNPYGEYGSPYSEFSACNTNATDPPVIVDQDGRAYGRVTLNQSLPGRGTGEKLYPWLLSAVCAYLNY